MRCLVWVLVFAACHDAAPKSVVPSPAPVAPGPDFSDPYVLLPADSDVIARIDFAALRRSPLWTKYKSMVFDLIAPSFASCDVDPLADLGLFTAGMPAREQALGVFVIRGLDREKYLHCLRAPAPETETAVSIDGDFITLTNKSGNVNMMTFVDAHTAVIQGSKGPTKQTLSAALKVGSPLRQDAAFVALDKRLAPHSALSFLVRAGSKDAEHMIEQKVGAAARYMYATLDLTERVEVHVAVALVHADEAAAIVSSMQPKIAAMKPYVDQLDQRAEGDTVYMDVAITEPQMKFIVDNFKRAMGTN